MALPSIIVREQLAEAPVRDVHGVVDSWGARIYRVGNQELWSLEIAFEAWKFEGEGIRNAPLVVYQQQPFEGAKAIRTLIKPLEVFRVRARVVERESATKTDGWLIEVIGEDKFDTELNDLARRLNEPLSYHDGKLGTFLLDRRLNRFEGDVSWNGQAVTLILSASKGQSPESAATVAHQLWESSGTWNENVYECAIRHLLKLKNDVWLQSDEPEITGDSFRARLKLQNIVVTRNDEIEFWFDDGDLFWGHAICVRGNLAEGMISAGLEG